MCSSSYNGETDRHLNAMFAENVEILQSHQKIKSALIFFVSDYLLICDLREITVLTQKDEKPE